jgi:beta-glucosidase/6-phospho-beta-glucosidase/beta-galactosidase
MLYFLSGLLTCPCLYVHLILTSICLISHCHFCRNGVNVRGYFYWTLFDDFEWGDGYNMRYGLYYIDFKDNFKRIPKHSALWFRDFLALSCL